MIFWAFFLSLEIPMKFALCQSFRDFFLDLQQILKNKH